MLNIDLENTIKKNLNPFAIQPHRAQIYVGFLCHQHCKFCYHKDLYDNEMFSFEQVKKQIDFEYEYGIREFELTGGEPSESKILRQICSYIRLLPDKCTIAIITNGGLYNSDVWDLIDEVLISYHICKDKSKCDFTIFPYGPTYNKVCRTVKKAKETNKIIRTNTVIAKFNLRTINYIVNDILEFKPHIINFLPINLFDSTDKQFEISIDYPLVRTEIKKQIDKIKQLLPDAFINVRYMPFCDMEGYEQHIIGQLQHIYDNYDWNKELDGIKVLELAENPERSLMNLGEYGKTSIRAALQTRNEFYEKSLKCISCKYYMICDGVEKTANHVLLDQIIPTKGKMIKDILYYYRQYKIK